MDQSGLADLFYASKPNGGELGVGMGLHRGRYGVSRLEHRRRSEGELEEHRGRYGGGGWFFGRGLAGAK